MEIVYMLELDFKKSENQFVYQNCMLKFAICLWAKGEKSGFVSSAKLHQIRVVTSSFNVAYLVPESENRRM